MIHQITILFIAIGLVCTASAQEKDLPYTSKIADLEEIRLEYKDFGGEGLPLIWVQDLHNYLEGSEGGHPFARLMAELAADFRVLAPVRRGYGKSTDTQWGYDVATQAMDLLRFMDAMGIEKACLFGGIPATQDMLYIAEHHPDRLAGLVFNGSQVLYTGSQAPVILEFIENFYAGSCDLEGRGMQIIGPRLAYRPDFLANEQARIDVPLLLFRVPGFDDRNIYLGWLDQPDRLRQHHYCGNEEAIAYFNNLVSDPEAMQKLKVAFEETDLTGIVNKGFKRAFGDRLKTVELDPSKELVSQAAGQIREFYKTLKVD